MLRITLLLLGLCLSCDTAWADPLDDGEGYVNRGAPDMLGMGGLALLMFNYVMFGLAAVVFGRALIQDKPWLQYVSRVVSKPWSFGVRKQWVDGRHWADIPLMIVLIVVWIFICQFFNEMGMGTLAMIGLALMAVTVLKLMKD
jgi:hypothetical protein